MRTLALDAGMCRDRVRGAAGVLFVAGLIALEIALITLVPGVPHTRVLWQDPIGFALVVARVAIVAFALFCVVAWPMRRGLLAARDAYRAGQNFAGYVIFNIACVGLLITARHAVSQMPGEPMGAHLLYTALLVATGASQIFLIAPPRLLFSLPRLAPLELAISIAGALAVLLTSGLAQGGWESLAGATLALSHWLLTLYEPSVILVIEEKLLGVGDFHVYILAPCSGYEGAGLVAVFVAIYLWTARRELRFPHALLLFPIGIVTIWLLNAVRIAALISIGAHASPAIALGGFHSQAGWIAFLFVTMALIAASRRVAYFRAEGHVRRARIASVEAATTHMLAYLSPFMALMAGSVVASAFVPHDQWLYALKVIGVSLAIWLYRDTLRPLLTAASGISVVAGLAVGVIWIATEPASDEPAALGLWLATLPGWAAVLWISVRAFGAGVLVPIAEELAFRGYLARALVSSRFENVAIGTFRPVAFVVSSLAFGLLHERWIAAILAGALFALLMYRTKRLSDPIVAHMIANAVIVAWAIGADDWALL